MQVKSMWDTHRSVLSLSSISASSHGIFLTLLLQLMLCYSMKEKNMDEED